MLDTYPVANHPERSVLARLRGWLRAAPIAALVSAVALWTAPAMAQDTPSLGQAVEVIPDAVGLLGGAQITLISGSDLFEGQTIETSASGEVHIIFLDDTRMVIGPNSTLIIERFLLRDPTTVSDLVVNALGGTFRFISGNSPSDAYEIRTPTGTIGVRGTEFDFSIDWITRAVTVAVYRGAVIITPFVGA